MSPQLYDGQCGYYEDRDNRNHWVFEGPEPVSQETLTRLLNKGYRRIGGNYYKPFCRTCHECTPYRIPVALFKPTRSQKRVLHRNENITVEWVNPTATREKFSLYVRYQTARHVKDAPYTQQLKNELLQAMIGQMYTNPASTLELVLRENGRLVGFAIFDRTLDALSAVYSVFDPDLKTRSLGTFNILQAVAKTKAEGLPYLNLGLWLEGHPKMAYKKNFQPAEIYRNFRWRVFEEKT